MSCLLKPLNSPLPRILLRQAGTRWVVDLLHLCKIIAYGYSMVSGWHVHHCASCLDIRALCLDIQC